MLLCALVSLALAPAQDAGLAPPDGVHILHTFVGEKDEHAGIGLSALGDVDGDGVPDFLVGSMLGAYVFGFGPGQVDAYSGASGDLIFWVRGDSEGGGDAFGDTVVQLGDVDGDGVPDFAVGAWRFQNYRGSVRVYSGTDGEVLHHLMGRDHGDPDGIGGDGFGGVVGPMGDVNGDDHADFAIGNEVGEDLRVYSGLDGGVLFELDSGQPLGPHGDHDGDGTEDVLVARAFGVPTSAAPLGAGTNVPLGVILSGVDGSRISVLRARGKLGPTLAIRDAGDVNGDGFRDLISASEDPAASSDQRAALETRFRVQVVSGRVAAPLLDWWEVVPGEGDLVGICGAGDLNGDGYADLLTSVRTRQEGGDTLVRIRSGADASVLHTLRSKSHTFGGTAQSVGDLDGDERPELLLGDYESQLDGKCAGRAYLLSFGEE